MKILGCHNVKIGRFSRDFLQIPSLRPGFGQDFPQRPSLRPGFGQDFLQKPSLRPLAGPAAQRPGLPPPLTATFAAFAEFTEKIINQASQPQIWPARPIRPARPDIFLRAGGDTMLGTKTRSLKEILAGIQDED